MLCEYAHVKGFALSKSLTCHSMMLFNTLTYSLNPLTKLLNPLPMILAPAQMFTDTLAKNEFLIKLLSHSAPNEVITLVSSCSGL